MHANANANVSASAAMHRLSHSPSCCNLRFFCFFDVNVILASLLLLLLFAVCCSFVCWAAREEKNSASALRFAVAADADEDECDLVLLDLRADGPSL